jgi:hypothetical protein
MADDNPTVETPKSDNDRADSGRGASSPPGWAIVAAIGSMIGGMYNAVMRGGELQAAFRMGIDEIGQALKAFPDAVQARAEPGGMFEPLHSDIAAARDQYGSRDSLPSPGDIANGRNVTAAEREDGNVQGRGKIETAQNEKTIQGPWTEKILEERERTENGDGQNELGRSRSLPDEQRDNENDRGR